ncbi:insulinase family protein [Marinobacter salicampi]|uniref:insulinase family protein n=1 Tax=Marinobacter salicampi TaxID=435907 RepID=UPI00140A1B6D|nr:insulinase family protein [Marinobacter salicampi]
MQTIFKSGGFALRHLLLPSLLLLWTVSFAQAALEPVKSPNDKNSYRYLTLNNGLEVLLISDPDSEKAAASLDVAVGSGDDPKDREGLSHFLEHMLFLGTEKYPDPGEYQQFIRSHGGSHNAFTAFQDTNYFFDIQAEHLESALDRFAQQFSEPLFTAELVERERRAVHSEFSSGLKDDGRRIYAAKKAVANPDHAFHQFSVGNLSTLDDTEADPLRKDLIEFWRNHYSANIMNLVVYGPQSLDELERMVRPRFVEIENRHLEPKAHKEPLFEPSELPAKLEIEALKDLRSLTLEFPIPSQQDHYRSKPASYVASLLGHEGPGSLYDVLRNEGLVESLSAGTGMDTGHQSTLELSMRLTEEGLAHQDRIISLAFDFIDKVRDDGITRRRFVEMANLADIHFRFREQSSPIQLVSQLSMRMHHVEPKDVLRAGYMMEEYRPELYKDLLAELTPDNVLVTLVQPETPEAELSEAPWYGTTYAYREIKSDSLTQPETRELADQLALPAPNPFIPEDLDMVPGGTMEKPEQLLLSDPDEDKGLSLWYARDTSFEAPKANVYLSLRSPETQQSASNQVLTQLLVDAINYNLNAWAYPAHEAGLNYSVYTHLRGVTIRVGGYDDKLHTLFTRILNQVAEPEITERRFQIARQNMIDSLRNKAKDRPVEQISEYLQGALIQSTWTTEEKLEAARAVTLDELEDFAGELLAQVDPVMLAHGNLSEASALNFSRLAKAVVLADSEIVSVPRSSVREVPAGETEINLKVVHPDTGYLLYLQGQDTSFETRAIHRLMAQVVSSPFYEELRTTRQLGYVVYATPYEMLETPALGLVVQSPEASGDEIDQAVAEFAENYGKRLAELSTDALTQEKQAVISNLLEKDRTLGEVSERYWREIDRGETDFDSREQLADAVLQTTHESLVKAYRQALIERQHSLNIVTVREDKYANSEEMMEMLRKRPGVR